MSRLHLDIHRDDTVQVMSGKDRGKRGVVVRTVPQQGKIVVKGVNVLKRHTRAGQQKGSTTVRQGGIVDIGIGEAISNPKAQDAATADLKKITGQQPVVLKSRKAIANFKLRAGLPIGIKVTLRGARMYQFVDKLLSVGLPRIRDFRGISPTAFDGHGNYTLGLREQLVFPEIEYDKIDKLRGLEVTFVTTARTDDEARALLTELGFPFRK